MSNQLEKPKIDVLFLSIMCAAFDIKKVSVRVGAEFRLQVDMPNFTGIEWFSNNDSILAIDAHNEHAIIKAEAIGESTIEIQLNGIILRTIDIIVTSSLATDVKFKVTGPVKK